MKNEKVIISEEDVIEHSRYLLQGLLPFLKRLNDEQVTESELEAKRQGIFSYQLKRVFYKFNDFFFTPLVLSFLVLDIGPKSFLAHVCISLRSQDSNDYCFT